MTDPRQVMTALEPTQILIDALNKIAICKSRAPGDVVDIAQKAIAAWNRRASSSPAEPVAWLYRNLERGLIQASVFQRAPDNHPGWTETALGPINAAPVPPPAVDAEVRKALKTYDTTVKRCPANTQFLGDRKCPRCSAGPDEGCRQEIRAAGDVITAVQAFLATPSGRAQGEVVAEHDREMVRRLVLPMVEERSRERFDAWDLAHSVLKRMLYAAPPSQDQTKGYEA